MKKMKRLLAVMLLAVVASCGATTVLANDGGPTEVPGMTAPGPTEVPGVTCEGPTEVPGITAAGPTEVPGLTATLIIYLQTITLL